MASMSAEQMAKAKAVFSSRRSRRQVLWKAGNDMAETLTVRGGGMSKVSALVRRGAQVVVQRREMKSMVSVAQSMAGL